HPRDHRRERRFGERDRNVPRLEGRATRGDLGGHRSAPYAEPTTPRMRFVTQTEQLRRSSRWGERLTPARIVAVAILGSIPVKLLTERLSDPDLWWHLRTGQLIVSTHHVPHSDVYSYTVPGRLWVVQEWFSEVIMYGLRRWFGLYGILFFRALLLLVLYALVARLIVRRMGAGMGAWVLLGLTAYAGTVNWTERPN